jgi:hypothetical protein
VGAVRLVSCWAPLIPPPPNTTTAQPATSGNHDPYLLVATPFVLLGATRNPEFPSSTLRFQPVSNYGSAVKLTPSAHSNAMLAVMNADAFFGGWGGCNMPPGASASQRVYVRSSTLATGMGSEVPGLVAELCPPGQYSNASSGNCSHCPVGRYSKLGSGALSQCRNCTTTGECPGEGYGAPVARGDACLPGWTPFGDVKGVERTNSCFMLLQTPLSWSAGNAACGAAAPGRNAHLLTSRQVRACLDSMYGLRLCMCLLVAATQFHNGCRSGAVPGAAPEFAPAHERRSSW